METTEITIQKRGQLTNRIKQKSMELLGYEISQIELRLMGYIMDRLLNNKLICNTVINGDDRGALILWVNKGYIIDGVTMNGRPMINSKLKVTKEFYNSINEILWLGYVDLN